MARLLVATVPLTGHVHPMLLLVRALVARGHECRWYAAAKFQPAITATGATFEPYRTAHDWDDRDVLAALPALRGKRGIARVKAQLREMFIAPLADQLGDLEAIATEFSPDAIVADQAHLGAAAFAERTGLPWCGVGISALVIPSRDVAPFGPGWRPARGALGRLRTRFLAWVVRTMFRDVTRTYRRVRAALGLATRGTYFDVVSPQLFLQPTIEAFEYPRSDLPPQVHFVGPLVAALAATATEALPPWWDELVLAHARGTPIVLVTQGTLATDARELVVPALRGLAREDVFVVATIGTAVEGPVPANARVAAYIPYQALLPLVAVVVTNGGYGGVQMALREGVPLVVAGGSEEKPEIAARVAWTGAGIDLRTGTPSAERVRGAVMQILARPGYRVRARELAAAMVARDAPNEGAALIERLIAQRDVVRRTMPT